MVIKTKQSTTALESCLSAARTTLVNTGKNPQQLAEENRLKVISWIYLWGYTTPGIIQSLLNRTSAGYGKRLAETGWLNATKTASGTPAKFFTLTNQGLEFAEHHATKQFRYPELDPQRVDQRLTRHNLTSQIATVNLLNAGLIQGYETERMFSIGGDQPNIKRPDVVWNSQNGLKIAVEIELTGKWDRDLDKFIFEIIQALKSDESHTAKFDRFAIVSDSQATLNRYSEAMQPNVNLKIWQKNNRQYWEVKETIQIPSLLISKINFHLLGH